MSNCLPIGIPYIEVLRLGLHNREVTGGLCTPVYRLYMENILRYVHKYSLTILLRHSTIGKRESNGK
jgi:hypothetical protein